MSLFVLTLVSVGRVHLLLHIGKLHPALLLFAFAAGYAAITPRALVPGSIFRYWPPRAMAGLLALACLSAIFGISLGGSAMFILTDYVKVIVFSFLIMAVIRGAPDLGMFIWAYVASCAVLVFMAVFVFRLSMTAEGVARLGDMYTYDANDLGCVLMAGLPLTVLAFQASRTRGKVVCGFVLAGMGWAIARSGSRGALVGLCIVGLAILIALKEIPVAKRVTFVAVIGVVLALTAPKGYWQQMETLLNPTQDYNWTQTGGRKQIWERGMHYMWTHPLFGVGINNFGRAEGTISELARSFEPGDAGVRWSAPHNSFLQAGAEMGLPGLILWSSLVFGGLVAASRIRRRLPASWLHADRERRLIYLASIYLPISFIGFAATAFFVSFAYLDIIYFLAALLVGLQRSAQLKLQQSDAMPAPAVRRPLRRGPYAASPRAGLSRH